MVDNIYTSCENGIIKKDGGETMRTVAPQKRQDHDISPYGTAAVALLLATLTALPSQLATAQAAVPCTAIADNAERLACYDRALRSAPPPAATTPPAAQAPPRGAPPAAVPAAPAAPAAAEPRRERQVRQSAVPAAPAAPAARTAPAAPAARGNEAPQIVPIVIVGVRALPGRETTFTAEDGTAWVQTDSQRITGLPDTPFDAQIKPGMMGSYFLVAEDHARAIRVRPAR
jgi:hypothetical protein